MDPVAICNMGLGFLGANQIRTIVADEVTSVEEELCAAIFEGVIRAALAERAWLFATGIFDLGAIAATPAGQVERADLPYRYQLPSLALAVRAVDDGSGEFNTPFERSGDCVLVYGVSSGAQAIVTMYEPDPKKWCPTFGLAIAHKIAALCAVPLTQKVSLHELHEKLYEREIQKAKIYDGMQGSTIQAVRVNRSSLANRR
jgi:hypothetical protein